MATDTRTTGGTRGRRLLAAVLGAVLLAGSMAPAGDLPAFDKAKATALKAACLAHLAEFTTWPQAASTGQQDRIVIGAVGGDPDGVGATLEAAVRDGQVPAAHGRQVAYRVLDAGPAGGVPPELRAGLAGCQILWVTRLPPGRWPALRALLEQHPTLTVSDTPGFAEDGGMVELAFRPATGRIVLRINLDAVEQSGLRLSSRLLGLKEGVELLGSRAKGLGQRQPVAPE